MATSRREYHSKYREKNREKLVGHSRQYRSKHPDEMRKSRSSWRKKNRKKLRDYDKEYAKTRGHGRSIKYKYGVSEEEYQRLFRLQGGLCEICKQPPLRTRLAVDHDHRTGIVRGLLHVGCNAAIGLLHDDPFTIDQALQYVLKHRTSEK